MISAELAPHKSYYTKLKRTLNIFLMLLLVGASSLAQSNIPKDYFGKPLDIPLILSGSFGELRSNHFHSGLDIKTQQRTGLPVYAPADGYVSRIKVGHYGYGKALYIKHPNGYSTVYAHLERYAGKIQDYVKKQQYRKESYEIELFPKADLLPVYKGDLIGYSGNTGSSGGPHLHFEIRDASSRPMNPMLFGLDVPDTRRPLLNSVMVYPVGDSAHVDQRRSRKRLKLTPLGNGSYKAETIKAYGLLGFGVSTYDQQNGASNKNGVYKIVTKYNGQQKFELLFERFSFAETRYLNRLMDYEYWKKNRSRVQKLFREENNPLSLIVQEDNSGLIDIRQGFSGTFVIEVSDYQGNTIEVTIPIDGAEPKVPLRPLADTPRDLVIANQATSLTKDRFSVYFPALSLYEDSYLDISARGDTLVLHRDEIPVHKNISITYDASNYATEDISKLFIGRLNYKGLPYYQTTYRKGDKLTATTRTFGTYTLVRDDAPPKVRPLNFSEGKWISNNRDLKIKIEDKLSGISGYRATINGKFILMEYDYKKDRLVYDFNDQVISETENNLKLVVTDNVGNSTTFETTFYRK